MKATEPDIEPDNQQDHQHRAELHSRIRRAKQILRPLPRRTNLHRWPILKWFAATARKRPYLWSFRVREVSMAIYLGSVIAFLPIYGFQLGVAFAIALLVRANLPVIIGMQLITNPVTAPFIYLVLTRLVGHELIDFWGLPGFDTGVSRHAYEMTIGGIVVGLFVGLILDLIYRLAFAKRLNKKLDVKRMLKS